MAITEAQREQRKGYIGSSDVACLAGVDRWRNAGDLFLEKTGRLNGEKSSTAADLGTDMEGAILNMFERRMNVRTERNVFLSRNEGFPACANLDGALRDSPSYLNPSELIIAHNDGIKALNLQAVVEAKSTSLQDEWGERTDEVPLRVLCQTQWQMWVAGCDVAWVPVLFPDFGRFRLEVYRVERKDSLIEELVYRAGVFWNECVVKDVAPSLVTPHLETLKRVRREPATVIELSDDAAEILIALEAAKAQRLKAEKDCESLQAKMVNMLGDAEAGVLPDGRQVTYLQQSGPRQCDFEALELELRAMGRGDLYERLVRQPRFRVMRVKKAGKK